MWAAIAGWAGGAWTRLLPYALAAGAALAVVAAIYRKGEQAARDSQEARQRASTINSYKVRDNVENALLRAPDGSAAGRLRDEWSRD
jgi:hypothetical protein